MKPSLLLNSYKMLFPNTDRSVMQIVGDKVFLKVSLTKGAFKFGKKWKLSPRYIGLFKILERIGHIAYRLALPPQLSNVHDVFHVSMLRKYLPDLRHQISYTELQIDENLDYSKLSMRILDEQVRRLKNKHIPMVKVEWQHYGMQDCIWETKEKIK